MIVDIEKQPTWKSLITDLEIGSVLHVPYSRRNTIQPLISKLKIELDYHSRLFETERVVFEGKDALKITRIA